MAAKETGTLTRGTNIEGVTTAVDLIDDHGSDSDDDNESDIPNLMDPGVSDDTDSEEDDDDDVGNDENVINHISDTENTDSGRQEMVNQGVNVNVTPGGKNTNHIAGYVRNSIINNGAASIGAHT